MRPLRALASASIALLVAITPRLASAYYPFPMDIQQHLGLAYTPPCTICHLNDQGGLPNTLVHPFGQAMYRTGLVYTATEAEVAMALDQLTRDGNDVDCNGIIDTTQLEMGYDPNFPGVRLGASSLSPDGGGLDAGVAGEGDLDPPDGGCANPLQPVVYGCSAQLSPAAPSWGGLGALVAALGIALVRRRL